MSNKAKPITPPNQALHDHVTSGAFLLSLTRSHVELLEYLYLYQDWSFGDRLMMEHSPLLRKMWVSASHGLQRRGLLTYHNYPCKLGTPGVPGPKLNKIYKLTKAGEAVIVLLKEAGLIKNKMPAPVPVPDLVKHGSKK